MVHPLFERIGASPVGRAGLASVAILGIAGLASIGLPMTCEAGASWCEPEGEIVAIDMSETVAETAMAEAESPAAVPPAEASAASAAIRTALAAASSAAPVAAAPTQVAALAPSRETQQDLLIDATFSALDAELVANPPALTSRNVRSVEIGPDGSPVVAPLTPQAEATQVAEAPPAETEPPPQPAPSSEPEPSSEPAPTPSQEPVAVAEAPEPAPPAARRSDNASMAYAPATGDSAVVTGAGANVRSVPRVGGSEVLFALRGGEEITIMEMQGGWARIVDRQSRSGWLYGRYLRRL